MPNIVLTCAETLGMSRRCDFFGDHINWRNIEEYSVRARVKSNSGLIAPLWSGISGFTPYVTGDYFSFIVNGVDLGSGKITSFSSDAGIDISNKFYDIGFQILKTGDLSFLTGATFSGLSGIYGFFPYLNSFNESFNYDQENNKTVDFSRNLDIEFERGFTSPFSGAFSIQSQVLSGLVDFGILAPVQPGHYWSGQGIKVQNETWDEINNRYSFGERYSYQSGLSYVWDYSHSLNFAENGITSLSENGKVTATKMGVNKIDYARSGWSEIETGIFGRLSGLYSRWSGTFDSTCPLVNDPVERSTTYNSLVGSIDYSRSYNNDRTNQSGFFWSYENSISLDQNGWTEASENGTLNVKRGETGQIGALISYSSGIFSGVTGRVNSLYTGYSDFFKNNVCGTGSTGNLTELGNTKSYAEIPASIEYSFNFTDDPSFIGTGLFRKVKPTYSDTKPLHLVNFFNVTNNAEIAQGSTQSTLGTLSNQIEIIGETGVAISGYYARAVQEIRIPSGVSYISNERYSFDPFSNVFTFNRDYNYSDYRAISDYQV